MEHNKLPLEDKDDCFEQFYPKCLGMRTKCENLINCHNKYAKTKTDLRIDFEEHIRNIEEILDESHKEFDELCKSEMKRFGKTTYKSYKEYMIDGIRSGVYPELQEEGFL